MSGDDGATGALARLAPLRGGGRGWVLATVAAGWFVTLGLRFVIPALLPQVKDTFGVDNAAAGLAVTLIWLTYAGMQLPAGTMVDRVGERRLLTASLLVAGTSLVTFGFAPSFAVFLLAASLFGLGTGLFGPPRGTVLSNTFRENDGAAFGLTLAAGSVGAAALPFVATQLSNRADDLFPGWAGWEVALAAFAPAFFVLAAGVWWAVPNRERRDSADGPAATDGGRTVGAVVDAATRRTVLVAAVGAAFMLFTFQGLTAFYTTYLVERKALTAGTAGALFAVLFVAGAAFQSVAGRAADRYGHGRVLVAIALLGIPPLVALPYVEGALALGLLTVPMGVRLAVGPVVNAYVVAAIPPAVQGTTWGLVRTAFFALGSTGSVAVGVFADAGQFDLAMIGLAVLTLPSVAIFAFLPARHTEATV
ncbi:MFS transporter [Halorientalis marina]|jgi:MFS family permease|uniref:MFS transporter n=1 Tax=Halorientalis marina TaxID=2931976 RepID=UPI001FF17D88|nr:MFS transporter [Halorientalis marina]